MRFVVVLEGAGDAVAGSVSGEGLEAPVSFSGWLELLALLEPPELAQPERSQVSPPSTPG